MAGIGAALIGAGGSLIGGLLGGKGKSYSPREMALGHVEGVMQASEAFNINPLTILGALGGPSAVSGGGGNYMGQAIADASLIVADAVSKRQDAQKLQQEQQRNRQLLEKIQSMTLRPKTGGIYANRVSTPNIASALGRGSENAVSAGASAAILPSGRGSPSSGAGARPLMDIDAGSVVSDPRREVENDPVKTHSGTVILDNPNLPFPIRVPTLDGDEPLQWYELPTLALPAAVTAYDFLQSPAMGPSDGFTSDGQSEEEAERDAKVSRYKRPKPRPDRLGWKDGVKRPSSYRP